MGGGPRGTGTEQEGGTNRLRKCVNNEKEYGEGLRNEGYSEKKGECGRICFFSCRKCGFHGLVSMIRRGSNGLLIMKKEECETAVV